jgi:hypothetical protein
MSLFKPRFISDWNQIRKKEGLKALLKKKGWKVIFVFFLFYLIRDLLLYILIPWLIIKGIILGP